MDLCISSLKFNNINSDKRKANACSFKGNACGDIFIKRNTSDDLEKIKQHLIDIRNVTESEKWNLIGSVKEEDCKANEEIRYFLKRGKYYDGLFTHELDRVFAKNKTDIDFTVYRGTSLDDFGYNITDKDSIEDFFEKGKVVVSPTYLSTTLDKDYSKKFTKGSNKKLLFKINTKAGLNAVYIDKLLTEQEKYMRSFKFDEENEVFIDKLAMLKMKDKYEEGEYTIIEFDTLGHEDRAKYMQEHNLKEI